MQSNSKNKKKNGPRNRSRRNTSQAANPIAQLLSILPSQVLGSNTSLGGMRGPGQQPKRRKARKSARPKQGAGAKAVVPLPPAVRDFVDNWHPFTEKVPLPFHTSNVEQTIASRGIRYSYEREVSCPANSTTWILIGCTDYLNVDSTSQHTSYFVQNGANYVMGPVSYSGPININSCIGYMYQRLNSVAYAITGNLTGSTSGNDVLTAFNDGTQQWPIASAGFNDAVRWCPLSYGIDIRRTNAALNAAGDWFSITPANSVLSQTGSMYRTNLNAFPSFKKHGSEHVNVQVMARPHDMAFQHCIAGAGATLNNPAILLNFENGTSNALSFDITVSAKFAIGGAASTKVLSSNDASPSHAHILSATTAAVSSGVAPGHASTAIADAVHAAAATGRSAMDAAASVGNKLKAAGEWLKPLTGAAAGFSLS